MLRRRFGRHARTAAAAAPMRANPRRPPPTPGTSPTSSSSTAAKGQLTRRPRGRCRSSASTTSRSSASRSATRRSYVPEDDEPIVLPRGSEALFLVQRIRDEAHRFAITFHRQVRGKSSIQSALDTIPGIGPKRKKALLKKFGSVKAIREADVDEIAATVGFTRALAERVKAEL
ncbi:MAG: hypothetical protein KatS3mg064_2451 [Tepidiforma sp.]|nr:helix-hairpin-helix domain-containing protein [Tepidiforma sp.]GIW19294.1 MAG: hypothetical protein KatS3mg064_2451 [Tepidiforma sp.]